MNFKTVNLWSSEYLCSTFQSLKIIIIFSLLVNAPWFFSENGRLHDFGRAEINIDHSRNLAFSGKKPTKI